VYPILFHVRLFGLDLTIQSYGTVIVLAFLAATWWLSRRATRDLALGPPDAKGVRPQDRLFNAAFAILFLGLLGARFVYAFGHYATFAARPLSLFYVWEGGLVGYGGLVVGLLWLGWWLPRQAEAGRWLEGRGWSTFDLFARGACLAFAIGWIAPLLAGDDYGRPTTAPWGIPLAAFEGRTPAVGELTTNPDKATWSLATTKLHPVQVYESLYALALFVVLGFVARRRPITGRVAALFLMLHAVGHAGLDLFRGDGSGTNDRGMLVPGVLSWNQFLAIPVFFGGLAIWLIRRPLRTGAHPPAPPPAPVAPKPASKAS
jgi:phosphatidylglycerol:prolipoprotein diacylglycerol transferase